MDQKYLQPNFGGENSQPTATRKVTHSLLKPSITSGNNNKNYQNIPFREFDELMDDEDAPFKFFNNLPRNEKLKLINFDSPTPDSLIVSGNFLSILISFRIFDSRIIIRLF